MKKDLLVTAIIISLMAFVTACSKSSSKSVSDKLIGTWTVTKYAFDSNNNNTADANEWQPLQTTVLGFPVTINATVDVRKGGTGSFGIQAVPYVNDSLGFNWTLVGNNQYVNIQTTGTLNPLIAPYIPNINGSSHIDQLDDHTLIIKDTTAGTSWIYMTK